MMIPQRISQGYVTRKRERNNLAVLFTYQRDWLLDGWLNNYCIICIIQRWNFILAVLLFCLSSVVLSAETIRSSNHYFGFKISMLNVYFLSTTASSREDCPCD